MDTYIVGEGLGFESALMMVKAGELVSRAGWTKKIIKVTGDRIQELGETVADWTPTQEDILAHDWYRYTAQTENPQSG